MGKFDEVMKLYQEGHTLEQIVEIMHFTSRKTLTNLIGRAGYRTINGQILPKDTQSKQGVSNKDIENIQKAYKEDLERIQEVCNDLQDRLEWLEQKVERMEVVRPTPTVRKIETTTFSIRIDKNTKDKFEKVYESQRELNPMLTKSMFLSDILDEVLSTF